jgi:hypothetical protein
MKSHICPLCKTEKQSEELNDDHRIDPKIRAGQLIHLRDEQFHDVAFRVQKIEHMTLTLEKL